MFTPCGRGVTHSFVDKLLTRVMFTPCVRGVTHTFVDKLLTKVMFTSCGRGVTCTFNQVMFICWSSYLSLLVLLLYSSLFPLAQKVDFFLEMVWTMLRRRASALDDLLMRNRPYGHNQIVL